MSTIPCAGSLAGARATLRHAASHDIQILASRSFSSARRFQITSATSTTGGRTTRLRDGPFNLAQRHAFTTSTPLQKTISLTGPRHDPEGKEMSIEITPRAGKVSMLAHLTPALFLLANRSQRLTEIIEASKDPSFALRIQVQSGGCHGFQYLTTNASIKSMSSLEEDETVFGFVEDDAPPSEGSSEGQLGGPKVVLDEPSLVALQGSKIDYTQELIGSKFEIVDNPLAENSCGCGSSFSLKL